MAPFELFVWGPAYGLPSIDPECNAAVALFSTYCNAEWVLYAHHDPRLVRAGSASASAPALTAGSAPASATTFPCLRHGDVLVSGFAAILDYFTAEFPRRLYPVPRQHSPTSTALAALLDGKGRELLDLYYHASDPIFERGVRPAYQKILPTYVNYVYPSHLHSAATGRIGHVSGAFAVSEPVPSPASDGTASTTTGVTTAATAAAATKPKPAPPSGTYIGSVLSALKKTPPPSDVDEVKRLAAPVLGPLAAALGPNRTLFHPSMNDDDDASRPPSDFVPFLTSTDFLAFAFLSAILPPEPIKGQTSLAYVVRQHYPSLAKYHSTLWRLVLHNYRSVDVGHALAPKSSTECSLPWRRVPADPAARRHQQRRKKGKQSILALAVSSAARPFTYLFHAFTPTIQIRYHSTTDTTQRPDSAFSPLTPLPPTEVPPPPDYRFMAPLAPMALVTSALTSPSALVTAVAICLVLSHNLGKHFPFLGPPAARYVVVRSASLLRG